LGQRLLPQQHLPLGRLDLLFRALHLGGVALLFLVKMTDLLVELAVGALECLEERLRGTLLVHALLYHPIGFPNLK
jgi:hypothetical protein